jgi:hypothetical protein
MSARSRKRADSGGKTRGSRGRAPAVAELFATLGDATRLSLVVRLSKGEPRSIAELTAGSKLTRQAITKLSGDGVGGVGCGFGAVAGFCGALRYLCRVDDFGTHLYLASLG